MRAGLTLTRPPHSAQVPAGWVVLRRRRKSSLQGAAYWTASRKSRPNLLPIDETRSVWRNTIRKVDNAPDQSRARDHPVPVQRAHCRESDMDPDRSRQGFPRTCHQRLSRLRRRPSIHTRTATRNPDAEACQVPSFQCTRLSENLQGDYGYSCSRCCPLEKMSSRLGG